MSAWSWYRNLAPRARLLLGVGIMGYAGIALLLSDQAEKSFGLTPTEEDRKRLHDALPKIRMVDKEE
ncbi:hypothetical protein K402DRAFT_423874 [Aulographum hederae CBS 113979]|uniref:Uncharacterized protein n=1 Tax=Aulographum hederae CBS 113979 TaxID=1176131 RepID=A0A6G1GR73_9PEZI|nr:hypothetical protein K402DRAFT_423874 [Aulographum hederae CBS 113979]